MIHQGENLIESLASSRPKIREQLGDARRVVRWRARAIDPGFVIWHRWQGHNVDVSRPLGPDQRVGSGRRVGFSVESFLANDYPARGTPQCAVSRRTGALVPPA